MPLLKGYYNLKSGVINSRPLGEGVEGIFLQEINGS